MSGLGPRMKLLGVGTNAKLVKGDGSEYLTAGLSLSPYTKAGGINVCSHAKLAQCFKPCLDSAGRGKFSNVQAARLRKTRFWRDNRDGFLLELKEDLRKFSRYCIKKNIQPCVRLNVLSDIQWEDFGIPQKFSEIQFYDYTKNYHRATKLLPDNYRLTLSYSNASKRYHDKVVGAIKDNPSINLAVVFRGQLPEEFLGRSVIDGDKDDLRFLDPRGVIVGLKAKGRAKHDTSGFVVDA